MKIGFYRGDYNQAALDAFNQDQGWRMRMVGIYFGRRGLFWLKRIPALHPKETEK